MRVALACGGSGGHIFPAFSIAEEIQRTGPPAEVFYICGKREIESAIFQWAAGEKVFRIESAAFGGAPSLLSPIFLIKLFAGFFSSVSILIREKPDLVVGFGGHASFPVILAARALGKKTLIHEQNVVPGVANRILARLANGVALSFPETGRYFASSRNARVTGNPIRAFIERSCREEASKFLGFSAQEVTVLVLGGSQGAQSINMNFLAALGLLDAATREKIQVLHLCGHMPREEAKGAYRRMGIRANVFSFFNRMDLAYGVADFAVGRAGATFLAEIAAKGIPAILIPYPHAGGHQLENAKVFSRGARAVVLKQEDLSPERLSALVADFIREARIKKKTGPRHDAFQRNALPDARKLFIRFMKEMAG